MRAAGATAGLCRSLRLRRHSFRVDPIHRLPAALAGRRCRIAALGRKRTGGDRPRHRLRRALASRFNRSHAAGGRGCAARRRTTAPPRRCCGSVRCSCSRAIARSARRPADAGRLRCRSGYPATGSAAGGLRNLLRPCAAGGFPDHRIDAAVADRRAARAAVHRALAADDARLRGERQRDHPPLGDRGRRGRPWCIGCGGAVIRLRN
jgi:hypothetical protein